MNAGTTPGRDDYPPALRDSMAALEHERWANWQAFVHSLCSTNEDGSLTIPARLVERWQRQILTPFVALSEDEKDSDRVEADKTLALLRSEGLV